jgi:hypothetical protein
VERSNDTRKGFRTTRTINVHCHSLKSHGQLDCGQLCLDVVASFDGRILLLFAAFSCFGGSSSIVNTQMSRLCVGYVSHVWAARCAHCRVIEVIEGHCRVKGWARQHRRFLGGEVTEWLQHVVCSWGRVRCQHHSEQSVIHHFI